MCATRFLNAESMGNLSPDAIKLHTFLEISKLLTTK